MESTKKETTGANLTLDRLADLKDENEKLRAFMISKLERFLRPGVREGTKADEGRTSMSPYFELINNSMDELFALTRTMTEIINSVDL
jgi:hypothetical protein